MEDRFWMSSMDYSTISKVLTKSFLSTGYISKSNSYRSKGVYNQVQLVIDLKGFCYLVAEYIHGLWQM